MNGESSPLSYHNLHISLTWIIGENEKGSIPRCVTIVMFSTHWMHYNNKVSNTNGREDFNIMIQEQPASLTKETKTCKESRVFRTGRVFPNDMNNHKTLFGGKLMSLIDEVASISAMRHCRTGVVTASTDSVDFLRPIHQMDSVCLESFVTYTGHTSIEVFVKVIAENLLSGERVVAATSFITFVARDADGTPTAVPRVIPETDEEQLLHEGGSRRSEFRKERRRSSKLLASQLTTDKYWD